jgi:hypothetical protein
MRTMSHKNKAVANLLQALDLGSSVAESDALLESARVETSAFTDLLNDRVDLVPGTKGSGKSALFRIFADFLPDFLLRQHKVVVAHGIQAPGDPVFHAFTDRFSKLSEEEFINFWCIYLVSLAHEHFIKGSRYREYLKDAQAEIAQFRRACVSARIPEITARKSLKEILEWSLHVLKSWRPKVKYSRSDGSGDWEFDLFGSKTTVPSESSQLPSGEHQLPMYVNDIKATLDSVLAKTGLSLWLMVDRLDEIFPRRSEVEGKALRGLLRAMRYFASGNIRVKVFLRDDMLDQVVKTENGFTALTHVTVRQADTLKWTNDQILAMVVKRFFANKDLSDFLKINRQQIDASASYRELCFYMVFPPTVYRGRKQSPTLRWICNRCADGRGVVTPRDVLDLIIRARQKQHDACAGDPDGTTEWIIGSSAIQYGFEELSKRKKQTYLQAEFPHLWKHIEKFAGGKTEYDETALRGILGSEWKGISADLLAIGFFSKGSKSEKETFSIPFLYRHGLDLTQGKA